MSPNSMSGSVAPSSAQTPRPDIHLQDRAGAGRATVSRSAATGFHPLCNDLFQRRLKPTHGAFGHFRGIPGAFDIVVADRPRYPYSFNRLSCVSRSPMRFSVLPSAPLPAGWLPAWPPAGRAKTRSSKLQADRPPPSPTATNLGHPGRQTAGPIRTFSLAASIMPLTATVVSNGEWWFHDRCRHGNGIARGEYRPAGKCHAENCEPDTDTIENHHAVASG